MQAIIRWISVFTAMLHLRRWVVCFSSRRPGLDSSQVYVELRCAGRDFSPYFGFSVNVIPVMLHIHLQFNTDLISRTSWRSVRISKQSKRPFGYRGSLDRRVLTICFSVFKVFVTAFIAIVRFTTDRSTDMTAGITVTSPYNTKGSQRCGIQLESG